MSLSQHSAGKSMQWHTQYDVRKPPSKADQRLVRFCIISDTHSTEPKVPDGDVLLHSGDLTDLGGTEAFIKQLDWLGTLPHKQIYIIGGNHDYGLCDEDGWYEKRGKRLHERHGYPAADPSAIKKAVAEWEKGAPSGCVRKYVKDERVEFDAGGRTWSLYGSPWSPEFGGWAWNYQRGKEAEDLYAKMPSTDILLTHSPPHKIGGLDVITDGKTNVGCEELTRKLDQGSIRPLLHCFGHIHEARGIHHQSWKDADSKRSTGKHEETLFVNASIVEMNMRSLYVQAAAKTPLIAAARWAGLQQREWMKIQLSYSVKNLPILVDVDPSLLDSRHERQPENKL